jgi:hypothetical protein
MWCSWWLSTIRNLVCDHGRSRTGREHKWADGGPDGSARVARWRRAAPSSAATAELARTAMRAASWRSGSSNARSVTKRDTVKRCRPRLLPSTWAHAMPSGRRAMPSRTASALAPTMPSVLPTESAGDAGRDGTGTGRGEGVSVDADTGVLEGEHRHDGETRDRVEDVLHALCHRDGLLGDGGHLAHLARGRLVGEIVGPAPGDLGRCEWSSGRQQPERGTGQRGVHARFVCGQPAQQAGTDSPGPSWRPSWPRTTPRSPSASPPTRSAPNGQPHGPCPYPSSQQQRR